MIKGPETNIILILGWINRSMIYLRDDMIIIFYTQNPITY